MQTPNQNQQPNDFCERCGVVHTQEPVDVEKVYAEALETIVAAEDNEWRKMAGPVLCEGEVAQLMREMGIDPAFLDDTFAGDSLAGEALRITSEQEAAFRERYKPFPHQQQTLDWIREKLKLNQLIDPKRLDDELSYHPVFVGGDFFDSARIHAAAVGGKQMHLGTPVLAGVSDGIFPSWGITRGVTRFRHPQLSQIPKTAESRKLFQERMQADGFTRDGQLVDFKTEGEYIPKAGSDARIMFMVDSFSPMDTGRMFIHEACHADTFLRHVKHGRQTGKATSMQHLQEYHQRAQEQIYAGDPGRPKACKVKRKAQKAARKRNRK